MERAIVSARAKREYVEAIYQRYRRAKRAEPPAPVAVRRRVRPRLSLKPVAQDAALRPTSSVTSQAAR